MPVKFVNRSRLSPTRFAEEDVTIASSVFATGTDAFPLAQECVEDWTGQSKRKGRAIGPASLDAYGNIAAANYSVMR